MIVSQKKELKHRLERAICERLVSKVCGSNEIAYKWGCMPNTDGYKEAERIFNEKYTLITFSQLIKEILITWYNELLYKEKKDKVIPEPRIDEEYYYDLKNDFNTIADWLLSTTIEDKLNGLPNEVKKNAERNLNMINKIDSAFDIVMDIAKNRDEKKLLDENAVLQAYRCIQEFSESKRRILEERTNELQLYIKTALINNGKYAKKVNQEMLRKKIYFLSALFKIFEYEDDFRDGYFKPVSLKVIDNIFQNNNYNEEIEKIINQCLNERENTLEYTMELDSRKRNKTSETILEKTYKKKINRITVEEFKDRYVAFIDAYYIKRNSSNKNEVEVKSIVDYYNIEKRYNLKFYTTMIPVLIDYINITKKNREEFLRRLSKLAIHDNYLFRHLIIKEVSEKIADELINDDSYYYDNVLEEIQDIIGIKHYIVNQMLNIESLQYKNIRDENIEEIIIDILNIKEEYLDELIDIDFEKISENDKIKDKIYADIKSLLNMSKDIGMENNEYINL